MNRLLVGTGFAVLLLSTESHAQSAAAPADAGHASAASCVILKRIGRMGRTESRLYHFGISGKQFRYVEGNLPEGLSRRGKMTDHDVRKLQARGAQVLVLDSNYTSDDLKEARANCANATVKTSAQVEAKASPQVDAKASPAPTSASAASAPALEPKPLAAKAAPKPNASASSPGTTTLAASATPTISTPPTAPKALATKTSALKTKNSGSSTGATEAALVDVSSTPAGADVYIDEHFFGRTPATTIILMPGNHKIAVKKDGFVVWKKKLTLPSGRTNLDAELLRKSE